jgi:hypothetical protein
MNKLLEYLGILMVLAGIGGSIYFFAFFNTQVVTGSDGAVTQDVSQAAPGSTPVNNIGLMADRQNGLVLSVGGAILGALFLFAGHGMTEKLKARESPNATVEVTHLCSDCGKYFAGYPAFCPNCGKPKYPS